MIQLLNPKTISAPNGTYSHGVLVTGASKFLVISGQVQSNLTVLSQTR